MGTRRGGGGAHLHDVAEQSRLLRRRDVQKHADDAVDGLRGLPPRCVADVRAALELHAKLRREARSLGDALCREINRRHLETLGRQKRGVAALAAAQVNDRAARRQARVCFLDPLVRRLAIRILVRSVARVPEICRVARGGHAGHGADGDDGCQCAAREHAK